MNKNYDYKRLTPFKWFVLQNFPFIDEDFDAITNYQLFCKLGEEINKLILSMNQAGEQVEELTDYVNNYFDNLDVQDEVNNKLDEMAEDGTLEEIITEYINLKSILAFNTVAEMKQATNLIDGSFVETYGFYSVNDGGNAKYKIREITNQDIVDEMTIIALQDTNLIAELINPTNVKQFGAKGDEIHDDTDSIQKAITYGGKVEVPKGNYLISDTLIFGAGSYLKGESAEKSKIMLANGSNCDMVNIIGGKDSGIENITLFGNWYNADFNPTGTNTEGNGIVITTPTGTRSTGLMFTNLRLEYIAESSIIINEKSWIQNWHNVSIFRAGKYGLEDYASDNNFYGLNIFGCEEGGIYAHSSNTHYFGGKIYVNSGTSKKASVQFYNCYRNTITGMEIQESYGDCFEITGGEYNALENVVLDGPGFYDKTTYGNHIGLKLTTTNRFSFIGGMITNGGTTAHQDKAIYIDSSSTAITINTLIDNARYDTPIDNNNVSQCEITINGKTYNNMAELQFGDYANMNLTLNQANVLKTNTCNNKGTVLKNITIDADGYIHIYQPGNYMIDYYCQVITQGAQNLLIQIESTNSGETKNLYYNTPAGNYKAIQGHTVINCPYGDAKLRLKVTPKENLITGSGTNHTLTIARL